MPTEVREEEDSPPSNPRKKQGTCQSGYDTLNDTGILDAIKALGLQDLGDPVIPGGRLSHYISNWRLITNDPWVLQIVQGYQIEWLSKPVQKQYPFTPKYSKHQTHQIDIEVRKLLVKGAIVETEETQDQFVGHLFLTPKKDGSMRPVFNLKKLNEYVRYEHFKMEGVAAVVDLLQPGDYLAKIDLKDAYFAVRVAEKDQRYLKFKWKGKCYRFSVLPFGLGSSPKVYTKLLKPVMALLRRAGIRCVIHVDDLLLAEKDPKLLARHVRTTLWLLTRLGFLINWDKCLLDPTQILEYLGFMTNTVEMTLALPQDKLKKIQRN